MLVGGAVHGSSVKERERESRDVEDEVRYRESARRGWLLIRQSNLPSVDTRLFRATTSTSCCRVSDDDDDGGGDDDDDGGGGGGGGGVSWPGVWWSPELAV